MKRVLIGILVLFLTYSEGFAAKLDHFSVKAPLSARAGEKFLIVIEAQDSNGNIVEDYKMQGKNVELEIGLGELIPKLISASDFKSGTIAIDVVCTKTQRTPVYVKDKAKYAYGRSELITIKPSKAINFVSTMPAGSVKIEALDTYGNLVTDYNSTGTDIVLVAKTEGIAIPSEIPASAFQEGVAIVAFIYDKPISFGLNVKESSKKNNISEEIQDVVDVEKENISEDNKKEAKQSYEKAVKLMIEEKYEEAKKELEKSLLLDPGNEKAKKLFKNIAQITNKAIK